MPLGFGLFALQLLADLLETWATPAGDIVVEEVATNGSTSTRINCGRSHNLCAVFRYLCSQWFVGGLSTISTDFRWFAFTRAYPEVLFGKLDNFALLSIPMFILMGAAIASTRAGADLYEALDRWLTRVPGGLVVSNLGACALFAAMSGSSPATCAAIGKMGIPEMRKRNFPDGVAAGSIAAGGTLGILIPPSITMIVYGIATETSIGRLFIAGVLPGLMLVGLFMAWSIYATWRQGGIDALAGRKFSWSERFEVLPRVIPFLLVILGVLYALYGGVATPSETAAVGALLCLGLAIIIYKMTDLGTIWVMLRDSTKESVMILFIIAAAGVFSYMLSSLFITQSIATWIGTLEVNRWVLMFYINIFLLVAGFLTLWPLFDGGTNLDANYFRGWLRSFGLRLF